MSFDVGDIVTLVGDPYYGFSKGTVMLVSERGQAYVRFLNADHRLDSWFKFSELQFISHSTGEIDAKRKVKSEDGTINIIPENQPRNIDRIQFGCYDIACWYYSPYYSEYIQDRHMYICDICALYFPTEELFCRHRHTKTTCRPPGVEIYRSGILSLFEVEGAKHKLFCQCISLLSKLFLNDIAVCYDVAMFNYYVLCEVKENGAHIVGFFSRDVNWMDNNILAAISVLPPFQQCGYGQFLITAAYQMSLRAGNIGSPEKPLSDLGQKAFLSYWKKAIIETIFEYGDKITCTEDFSTITAIHKSDIVRALRNMNLLNIDGTLNIEAMMQRRENGSTPTKPKILFDPNLLLWNPSALEEEEEEEDE